MTINFIPESILPRVLLYSFPLAEVEDAGVERK
jgi:hypothetical protein